MELIQIFKILKRWSWLIFSLIVVTVIILLLGLKLAAPKYEAQVKIQISTPQQEDVAVYDQYAYVDSQQMITLAKNNFINILKSDEIKNRASEEMNVVPDESKFKVDVKSDNASDYIIVTISAKDSLLASTFANTLVAQAIKYYGELRAQSTIGEMNLYAEQLDTAEDEYRAATDEFSTYKAQNSISSLPEEINIVQGLIQQLQASRDQLIIDVKSKDQIDEINQLLIQRQKEADRLLALAPMYQILEENFTTAQDEYNNSLTTNAIETVRSAALEKFQNAQTTFTNFKTENQVTSLQTEIDANNESIKQLQLELDQQLLSNKESQTSLIQVNELITERKAELDQLSSLLPHYNVLEEKTNEAQAKYQHILDKYTEAELKATVVRAANFIQVIEPAYEPLEAVSNTNLLILGLLGSLGLGILLAFLFDYLTAAGKETSVPVHINSLSIWGLPIIGRIPVMNNLLFKPDTLEAASINQLFANIALSSKGKSVKKILITSPQGGDGKTRISANLGVAMAERKSKIVLVDADLRNPFLNEILNQPNLTGMADLLSADEDNLIQLMHQYIRKTNIPGLSLLTSGKCNVDPSLLITSQNMSFIFEELTREFEYVLIDCPPFFISPDSAILSQSADGILIVVSPGKTSLRAAEEAVNSYKANESNILGVVLNRVSHSHYSSHYYYPQPKSTDQYGDEQAALSFQKATPDPDLVSVEQAAKVLGVQNRTVTRWCEGGQLNAKRKNLRWWVNREDLQDFIENRLEDELTMGYFEGEIQNKDEVAYKAVANVIEILPSDETDSTMAQQSNLRGEKALISISEVANKLGMHRSTITRWCREGRIPSIKQRGRWWVKREI